MARQIKDGYAKIVLYMNLNISMYDDKRDGEGNAPSVLPWSANVKHVSTYILKLVELVLILTDTIISIEAIQTHTDESFYRLAPETSPVVLARVWLARI